MIDTEFVSRKSIPLQARVMGGAEMPIEAILKNATGLPDKYVEMVVSYIHFLQSQTQIESSAHRSIGVLSNRFEYISDDFDEPLSDFREYME